MQRKKENTKKPNNGSRITTSKQANLPFLLSPCWIPLGTHPFTNKKEKKNTKTQKHTLTLSFTLKPSLFFVTRSSLLSLASLQPLFYQPKSFYPSLFIFFCPFPAQTFSNPSNNQLQPFL